MSPEEIPNAIAALTEYGWLCDRNHTKPLKHRMAISAPGIKAVSIVKEFV
jgi:hypothetical protein